MFLRSKTIFCRNSVGGNRNSVKNVDESTNIIVLCAEENKDENKDEIRDENKDEDEEEDKTYTPGDIKGELTRCYALTNTGERCKFTTLNCRYHKTYNKLTLSVY